MCQEFLQLKSVRNSCSERILAVGVVGLGVRDSGTPEASDTVRLVVRG